VCGVVSIFLLAMGALPDRASDTPATTVVSPGKGPGRFPDTIFSQLDRKDGLGTTAIHGFMVDGDGFLWIASEDGLLRWDGYRFHAYAQQMGVPGSLPDNYIRTLCRDGRGRLWIGTESGGLARYIPERDDFETFLPKGSSQTFATIYAIAGEGDDGLWLATGSGLEHFDIATGSFEHVALAGMERGPRVNAIARAPNGSLWLGTSIGLLHGNARNTRFTQVEPANGHLAMVTSLLLDRSGLLWVGTKSGAFLLDKSGSLKPILEEDAGEGAPLSQQWINAIAEAEPETVWLGTEEHGIVAIDTRTLETHRIVHTADVATSLANDEVSSLYRDPAGTIWVGTRRGISRADTTLRGISTFYGSLPGPDGGLSSRISDVEVPSVLVEPNGAIALGLHSQGIEVFDREGVRIGALRPTSSRKRFGLPPDEIESFALAPDGTLYLATKNGVFRTDGNASRLSPVPFGHPHPPGALALLFDRGTLWIGTTDGLWTQSVTPDSWKRGIAPAVRVPLPETTIRDLARGPGDDLWIATAGDLLRLNVATRQLERIPADPLDPKGLTSPASTVRVDRESRVWATTYGGGLCVLDHRDARGRARFRRIGDGLPNQTTDTMLEARDGTIWVSTDDGLAAIDPRTYIATPLRAADGVAITDYYSGSGYESPDGRLLFGGVGGLTIVQPSLIRPWSYVPPVVLTEVQIGGKTVPVGLFGAGKTDASIEVGARANSLSVEFAALDYTAPEQNRYAYRLTGYDPNWIETDARRRIASYTNLPPGRYTLELRGSNRNGVWGITRRIPIRVLPRWYQTAWARVGEVLASLLLLGILFQLGRGFTRGRQRELERQVALRTAELEAATRELRLSQKQLEEIAYFDTLTALANRRMFDERLRRLLALKRRQQGEFILMLLDLDRFKLINDTHGHAAGDAVLRGVADRLNPVVRESDCFARLGGDEFAIILAAPMGEDEVGRLCAKIAERLEEPLLFEGIALPATFSIGIAAFPEDGGTQEELYRAADQALYEAKLAGRNTWRRVGASGAEDA
jgi:diguanylate cyclase (GGDEF)-like protein